MDHSHATTTTKPPRRTLRRVLLSALGLVIVMTVGVPVLFLLPATQNYIISRAEQSLSNIAGSRVEIGAVHALPPGTFLVRDIAVTNDSTGDSLAVRALRVRMPLVPLLRRQVHITRLELEGVRALVTRRQSGAVSPVYTPDTTRQADTLARHSPWKVTLGTINVSDVAVCYRDVPGDITVCAASAAIDAAFARLDSVAGSLELQGVALNMPGFSADSLRVAFKGTVSGTAVQADALVASLPGASAELAGTLLYEGLTLNARYALSATGDALARFLPTPRDIHYPQQVRVDGTWEGAISDPHVTLHFAGERPGVRSLRLQRVTGSLGYPGDARNVQGKVRAVSTQYGEATASFSLAADTLFRPALWGAYRADVTLGSIAVEPVLRDLSLSTAALGGARVDGTMRLSGTSISTQPDEFEADISVAFADIADTAPLQLRASAHDRDWSLSASYGANYVVSHGQLQGMIPHGGEVAGSIDAPSLLTRFVGVDSIDGTVSVRGSFLLDDSLRPTFEGIVRSPGLSWRSIDISAIDAGVAYDGAAVSLTNASVSATGLVEDVLSQFVEHAPVSGMVDVQAMLDGPVTAPTGTFTLTAPSLVLPWPGAVAVDADLALEGGAVRVSRLHVADSLLEVALSGLVQLDSVVGLDIDGLLLFPDSAGARTAGQLHVEGMLDGARHHLEGTIDGLTAELAELFVPVKRELPVGEGHLRVQSEGMFPNPRVSVTGGIDDLRFSDDISMLVSVTGQMEERLVELDMHTSSSRGGISVHAIMPMTGQWRPDFARDGGPRVSWQSDTVVTDLAALFLPSEIALSGSMWSSGELRLTADGVRIDGAGHLADAAVAFVPDSLGVENVNASATVSGMLTSPDIVLVCTTGTVTFPQSTGEVNGAVLQVRLQDRICIVDTALVHLTRGGLGASASFPLDALPDSSVSLPGQFVFSYEADRFPLRMLSPFVGGIDIRDGRLNGSGTWRVGGADEFRDGEGTIDGLVARVEQLRPDIGPLHARVVLGKRRISLDTLTCTWGRGAIRGSAAMEFGDEGGWPLNARLEVDRIRAEYGREVEVRIDSSVVMLSGDKPPYLISGAVILGRSSYRRPIDIVREPLAGFVRNQSIVAPNADAGPIRRGLRADLRLRSEEPLTADLGFARVRGEVDLTVQGILDAPRVTGEVVLVDGYVRYLDRRFTVKRGRFGQYDATRLNPDLDLEAVTELAPRSGPNSATSYMVTLQVGGTMDKPNLTLFSSPPLSQVDIISLLTIGHVRDRDDAALALESGSDLVDVLADKAKAYASQQAANYVTSRIENRLKLDEFSIEGNLFNLTGNDGPRLTVTKQVRDRVSITYQSVIGDLESQRFKLSLKLLPFLFLEGDTDARSDAGVDLRTKFSF